MSSRIAEARVIVASPGRNFVTLKLVTEDGVVGWGDATLNGRELAVAAYLRDHIAPLLIGRDAQRIEDTWQYFYRGAYWRRGPVTMAAIGAIDMALWDIKGKQAGLPVYQLLGGAVRERILTYTHATGADTAALLDSVQEKTDLGFRAVRVQTGVPGLGKVYGVSDDDAYEPAGRGNRPPEEPWDTDKYLRHIPGVLAAVRDKAGAELKLLHDVHHRLTPTEATRLARAVEDVNLFWLEDVTPAENQALLRQVRQHTTVPLAIGEVFNTVWDCQQLISERLIDYIRTCVVHAGGISHVRKIFQLAELYQVQAAPHGPSDVSPINLAASLHLGMATHNFAIQEYMGYPALTDEAFPHHYAYSNGHLHPGDAPGLGVELDEEFASRHPYEPAYLPVARLGDGTLTNW